MQDDFRKKILEIKFDIFPLDKLLPIETVYSIFKDIYEKEEGKVIFLKENIKDFEKGILGFLQLYLW